MNDPLTLALVFVGGAGGSAIRWLVGIGVGERYKGSAFPLATFLINVSGAFVMGLLSTLLNVDWKDRYGSNLTALVLTGVLGGCRPNRGRAWRHNSQVIRITRTLIDAQGRNSRVNRRRYRRRCA